MRRALAHVHVFWSLQVLSALLAAVLAVWPWLGWPLWLAFALALTFVTRQTFDELAQRPRLAWLACLLGHAPGMLLATYVAGCFAHMFGEASASMVGLQTWIMMWTPVLSLVPRRTFHMRGYYVWASLCVPFVQFAFAVWSAGRLPWQASSASNRN